MRFVLLLMVAAAPVLAQTSDGEYYDAFSASTASVVKVMHATIQRDLAEARLACRPKNILSSRRLRYGASASWWGI